MQKKGIIVIGIIITIIAITLIFPINPLDIQPKISDNVEVKDSVSTTIDEKIELDETSTIVEEKKHYTISVRDEPIIPK